MPLIGKCRRCGAAPIDIVKKLGLCDRCYDMLGD